MRLPARSPPVASVSPSAPVSDAAARRVVVVEDNADAREMLSALLSQLGHTVFSAKDGPEGVSVALSSVPDLVLVDVGLPGFDGHEVARRVREHSSRPPLLVALTGYGSDRDRVLSLNAGFDTHLVKPVTLEALEALLSAAGSARAPMAG
jgi:DNA-binding response OmpR family regulator